MEISGIHLSDSVSILVVCVHIINILKLFEEEVVKCIGKGFEYI